MDWRFWRMRIIKGIRTKKMTDEEFQKLDMFEHFVPGCALFGNEERALDEVRRTLKNLRVYCSPAGFDVFMNMVIMIGHHKEFIEYAKSFLQDVGSLRKDEFYLLEGRRMYLCSHKRTVF